MTNNKRINAEIDIMQLIKAVYKRIWLIILSSFISGGAAFAFTYCFVTPLYQSSAMMYVSNSSISLEKAPFSISSSELTAAQSLVGTYIVILNTRSTLNEVIKEADVPYTYEELKKMINANAVNSTEVFQVTVTSPNPEETEKIANTIARVLPGKIADVVEGSSVRVVDNAVVPLHEASPNYFNNTAIGILVGIAFSIILIILLEMVDNYVRSEDYLIQTYDIPVLAVIPNLDVRKFNNNYYRRYGAVSKNMIINSK